MIFVMVGTNPYPFDRLLRAISKYADETGEEIIAQIGNTPPRDNIECHRYLDHSDVMKYISSANVVVCQGGYGSICDSLSLSARTVVVPRRIEAGECVDNQIELVSAFAKEGLIIPVMDIADLPDAIAKARVMHIKEKKPSRLPGHIAKTIQNMLDGT
jgi:UDP-N-acetylglucosamine transferase subunit ALG13